MNYPYDINNMSSDNSKSIVYTNKRLIYVQRTFDRDDRVKSRYSKRLDAK